MKNAIITGITGQDGAYLAQLRALRCFHTVDIRVAEAGAGTLA